MDINTTPYGIDDTDDEDWLTADETPEETQTAEQAEEPEEAPAEAPEAEQATEEAKESTADQPAAADQPQDEGFELTYDGAKVKKSRAETIALAQIGMNQQRAVERAVQQAQAEALKPYRQTLDRLNALAAGAGVSAEQLLEQMAAQSRENEVARLVDLGTPEAEARELVRLREEDSARKAQSAPKQPEANQETKDNGWGEFIAAYPDLVDSYAKGEAPQAFTDALAKGMPPVVAQMAVEMAALREENKKLAGNVEALQKASEIKKKAPAAVGSYGAGKSKDPFEAIFDED